MRLPFTAAVMAGLTVPTVPVITPVASVSVKVAVIRWCAGDGRWRDGAHGVGQIAGFGEEAVAAPAWMIFPVTPPAGAADGEVHTATEFLIAGLPLDEAMEDCPVKARAQRGSPALKAARWFRPRSWP